MAEASTSRRSVTILSKQEDYEPFLQQTKTTAKKYNLWDHINPDFKGDLRPEVLEPLRPSIADLITKEEAIERRLRLRDINDAVRRAPQAGQPPLTPTPFDNTSNANYEDLNGGERIKYKEDGMLYERKLKQFDRDVSAINTLCETIQQTVGRSYVYLTYDCDTPLEMMEALKAFFQPTDLASQRRIRLEWNALLAEDIAKRVTDVPAWLMRVEIKYTEARRYAVAEISPDSAVFQLLDALHSMTKGQPFATQWDVKIAAGDKVEFTSLIKQFRDYLRNTTSRSIARNHSRTSAFGSSLQGLDDEGNPVTDHLKGSNNNSKSTRSIPTCLCGKIHWYSDCWYLNNKLTPPRTWKQDLSVRQKVDTALKEDKKKDQVKRSIDKWVSYQLKKDKASESNSADQIAPSSVSQNFMTNFIRPSISTAAVENYTYELANSFILDSGSDGHVCNNASRMTNLKRSSPAAYCRAGNSFIDIEGWGSVTLNTKCKGFPNGRPLTLSNVAYIPSFHCSLVSFKILKSKGMWWNTQGEVLTLNVKEGIFCETPMNNKMWTVEYNPVQALLSSNLSSQSTDLAKITTFKAHHSAQPPPALELNADEAHEILGHLNAQALQHLPTSSSGLKFTGGIVDPNCQICSLGDATQIVSRRRRQYVQLPFHELCWDIVYQDTAFDDNTKLSHLWCPFLKYHFVFGLTGTGIAEIMSTIEYTTKFIKKQYNTDVKVISIDGEQSLTQSNVFSTWRDLNGIEVRINAPHAKQQHGAAERSGGVLTLRATKLHLSSGIPKRFWRYLYETAGYLLNRSPTRALGWKSPLQTLNQHFKIEPTLPSLNHLKPFGCRAYAYIYGRPKLDKLGSRAHIGYLVGYLSTNIWSIWVPSIERVIAMRDVTFDLTKRYTDDDNRASDIKITEQEAIAIATPAEEVEEELEKMGYATEPAPTPARRQYYIPPEAEKSIDAPGDTIVVQNRQLRTPSATPEPSLLPTTPQNLPSFENRDQETTESTDDIRIQHNTETTSADALKVADQDLEALSRSEEEADRWIDLRGPARRNINSDIDTANQTTGKRLRKPSSRNAFLTTAYSTHIKEFENPFYNSFASAIQYGSTRKQIHRTELPPVPRSWTEMLRHTHSAGFRAATLTEHTVLKERNTWTETLRSTIGNKKVLPGMWVFTYKLDEDGYLIKYKARFVVRGDLYRDMREETYAATLGARVFRSLMAIANHFDLEIQQFDAVNAFTNAYLDTSNVIYIDCPNGYEVSDTVLRLNRALYGLPHSPLLWYNELFKTMKKLGLRVVPESECLFTNDKLIVFFYVDDIAVLFHHNNLQAYEEFRDALFNEYEMKDLGQLKWFLGIRILRDRSKRLLWLSQDAYIKKIVTKFGLEAYTAKTPIATDALIKNSLQATPSQIRDYQAKVGSINYPAVITRPDIAYTASKLSEHLQNPSFDHIQAAERCISYLNYTKNYALEYGRHPDVQPTFECGIELPLNFTGYSDASHADDKETRRSTQGHKTELFGGTNDWQVKKQATVATSTTEAELTALATVVMWLLWYQRFFANINLDIDQKLLTYCDNLQTVRLMTKESPKLVTKLKHVDIKQHWLREKVEDRVVDIQWISTSNQAADGLTKALPAQKHYTFLKQLRMTDITKQIDDSETKL